MTVQLIGEPVGVKEGGVLSQVQREINVEALPMEIPEHLELDVSGMAIGDTLRLADLAAAGGRHLPRRPRGDGARDASTCRRARSSPSPRKRVEGEEGAEGEVPEGEEAEGAAEGEAAGECGRAKPPSPSNSEG